MTNTPTMKAGNPPQLPYADPRETPRGSTKLPGSTTSSSSRAGDTSRTIYILLAILLGSLGIHNFYARRRNAAWLQLALGITGLIATAGLLNILLALWAIFADALLVTHDGQGHKMQ